MPQIFTVPDSIHRVRDDFSIADHDTAPPGEPGATLDELREQITDLQARFLAEESRALLIVLQGIDGAGKDTVITNVISAFDPAGCRVFGFKQPSGEEAAHDFLWRFHPHTPARGMVHVFDRSYYEEVIAARVHGEVDDDTSRARLDSINDFESLLAREGTVILKFFLHISKDEQAERVRERLEQREKQADFSAADVNERDHWKEYDRAYEDAVSSTSRDWAPWFAIPADDRAYSRVAVATVLRDTLEALDPQYPGLDDDELRKAGLR